MTYTAKDLDERRLEWLISKGTKAAPYAKVVLAQKQAAMATAAAEEFEAMTKGDSWGMDPSTQEGAQEP